MTTTPKNQTTTKREPDTAELPGPKAVAPASSVSSDPARSLAIGSPLAIVLQRKADRGDDDAAAKLAKLLQEAATIAQDLPPARKFKKKTKARRLKKRKAAARSAAVELVEAVVDELPTITPPPETPTIAVRTFEDVDYQIGSVEWLWEPFVPRGMVTMVAARAKGGKTRFVIGALVAPILQPDQHKLPDGTTWTRPKGQWDKVLWIDTESGVYTVNTALRSLELPCNRVIVPTLPESPEDPLAAGAMSLANKDWQDRLRETIEQERPAMLVVDSLTGAANGDLNSNQTTQPVMQFLADIATQYKIAVVLLHHCNKPKPGKPEGSIGIFDITGHSSIQALARSYLLIDKPNGNDPEHRRLRLGMSGFCDVQDQRQFGFRLTPMLEWTEDIPQPEDQTPTTSEAVASAVEWLTNELRNGPIAAKATKDHAKANGITDDALRRAKDQLKLASKKQGGMFLGGWSWHLPGEK